MQVKHLIRLIVFCIAVCLPAAARAQDINATPIANDFVANDAVLELTVPKEYDGISFFVVWDPSQNYAKRIYGRAGVHTYDIRTHPGWKGRIQTLGVTAPMIQGRIKIPTLDDEIDMFLDPQRFSPTNTNFLEEHTFMTWPLAAWLYMFMAIPVLYAVVRRRKQAGVIIGVAFLAALAILQARTIYDDVSVISEVEKYQRDLHGVFPLAGVKVFSDEAVTRIGNSSWGYGEVEGIYRSYFYYRLAERPYIPTGSTERPQFLVSQKPEGGTQLYAYYSNYLLKPPPK